MIDKTKIPLPAAIANCGPFRVVDSKGNKNFCVYPDTNKIGILSVPLGEKLGQFAIRLHEYGHLMLISSGFHGINLLQTFKEKGVDESWFQSALDVVVNHYLLRLECEEISYLPLTTIDMYSDNASAAQTFLISSGLKTEEKIKAEAVQFLRRNQDPSDIEFLKTANEKLIQWSRQRQLPVEDFITLIRRLEQIFEQKAYKNPDWGDIITAEEAEEQMKSGALEITGKIIDQIDIARTEICYDLPNTKDRTKRKRVLRTMARIGSINLDIKKWNNWGKMEIAHLPLTEIHPTRKNAKKFLPGFVGAFRYPHRALIPVSDGAAFAYRQKTKGGTILLDCSGSMDLSVEAVSNFLYRAPMLTVAGYAGTNNKKGSLAIFIKNGILASKNMVRNWHEERKGGNVIDGPALRWLIKQRRPHIWISDGEVTGISDHGANNLYLEVAMLKKLGEIKQFIDIESCLKAFRTE
ncbi:MAG: hypothetical protein A3J46_02075 [Candidatus Yanofskybacteria bacterium RIFCSPHIGHO2_02_FULL_41_11]|uniref:Uncharacterized protein n=1 Tax=Candidatus Yanofskybacteria bacterium RIFCSPHIGHO2_02_FULL_41_11 TaxID=1802675 RepID=A0A1F8F831_9BACT|nr:MAG: hypothetical protein A3J46_02075 [Candidatus Yanofskybacteria bacterium RIFCSPHIGHO2_02_FULL_41_11]